MKKNCEGIVKKRCKCTNAKRWYLLTACLGGEGLNGTFTLYEGKKQSTPLAMTWQTWSSRPPTSSWKAYVSAFWKVAQSFLPWGPVPTVPTQTCRDQTYFLSETQTWCTVPLSCVLLDQSAKLSKVSLSAFPVIVLRRSTINQLCSNLLGYADICWTKVEQRKWRKDM